MVFSRAPAAGSHPPKAHKYRGHWSLTRNKLKMLSSIVWTRGTGRCLANLANLAKQLLMS